MQGNLWFHWLSNVEEFAKTYCSPSSSFTCVKPNRSTQYPFLLIFFFNMSLQFHFFSSVMLDSFTRRMLLPDIRSMANEPPLLLWSLLFLCFLPTQLSDFSRFLPFTSRLVISIFLFQKGRGEEDWDLWKKLNYYYPYFTNRRAKLDKARRWIHCFHV